MTETTIESIEGPELDGGAFIHVWRLLFPDIPDMGDCVVCGENEYAAAIHATGETRNPPLTTLPLRYRLAGSQSNGGNQMVRFLNMRPSWASVCRQVPAPLRRGIRNERWQGKHLRGCELIPATATRISRPTVGGRKRRVVAVQP